jgi:hypothetical protein
MPFTLKTKAAPVASLWNQVCLAEVICGSESFQTGEELESLKGTTVLFVASRYAPDGKMYAQAPSDGTIRLWKTNRSE